MEEQRFTVSHIGELIASVQGMDGENERLLKHRVRYLAKKGHLSGGRKIDERGTLDFANIEVFRAALYCELLAASMDIQNVRDALNMAQEFRPLDGNHPPSARVEGGWTYRDGGLGTAARGVEKGEDWRLILTLKRPGYMHSGGLRAYYTWSGEGRESVDHVLGRKPTALTIKVDLNVLFGELISKVGTP